MTSTKSTEIKLAALDTSTGKVTEIKSIVQLIAMVDESIAAEMGASHPKTACPCGKPTEGGRYSCCAQPICYDCYDKEPVSEGDLFSPCNKCKGDRGWVRVKET
jgi:hypothetical protein